MAQALSFICYMHARMATTPARGGITPFEIIQGQQPSLRHCYPWGTKAFVLVPKERTEDIRRALSEPAPEEIRVLSWNMMASMMLGGLRR